MTLQVQRVWAPTAHSQPQSRLPLWFNYSEWHFQCRLPARCFQASPAYDGNSCATNRKEGILIDNPRLIASFNYFSILFAPVLFPLVLLFASGDRLVRRHAKRALVIQLLPAMPLAALLVTTFIAANEVREAAFIGMAPSFGHAGTVAVLSLLYAAFQGVAFVWCAAAGIRALRT